MNKQKCKKGNIKSLVFNGICVAMLISITVAMPVVAKTSNWSMTLYHCVCDGYDNDVLYSADEGDDIEVTGTVTVVDKAKGALDKSNATYCIVYRKQFIGYEKLATQKLDTFKNIGDDSEVDILTEATKDSKKYYLYFYKGADDGFDLEGSGTITID